MAGDSHNAWAYNLLDPNTSLPFGAEFDDASVTPPGLDALTQVLPGMPKGSCLCGVAKTTLKLAIKAGSSLCLKQCARHLNILWYNERRIMVIHVKNH